MENKISVHCDSEGRTNQLCPYARAEFGVVIMGDYQCRRCEYYRGKDETTRTISCSHPMGHTVRVYATDEELRERWRHINLLKIEADTMFDEEDNVNGVKVWSVSEAKEIAKEILAMEKKTKKMTKAEAFEYLKGKKVLCKVYDKMEAVQGFVKSLGFHWSDYSEEPMLASILFLGEDGRLTFSVSLKRFEEHEYEEISADDILSIEIVDDKFSYDRAVELAKPLMHYLNEVGFPDSIRINQLGIIHEPMSTLIFDNGIGE